MSGSTLRVTSTPGAKAAAEQFVRQVKPFASRDKDEARLRVKAIYKQWQRYTPRLRFHYSFPQNMTETRLALKRQFLANKDVQDIRAVDLLVHKASIELHNTRNLLNQGCHVMNVLFPEEHIEPKPTDFMSKFLQGR